MDRFLRRKWTFTTHGQKVVFIKKSTESVEHVLMKAFIWALYLPQYPNLTVEVRIGDRYKPDVVQLDDQNTPMFWGESGVVKRDKIRSLTRRFRDTHFAIAKWDTNLKSPTEIVKMAIADQKRTAPFDLIRIPEDSAETFINDRNHINISFDDLEWLRLE
jgi:hypothetical protein